MIYELKIIDRPGGLQVTERYKTLTSGTFETAVLISTAVSATLVTAETYNLLSNEPTQPMKKNLDFKSHYIPAIPNPQKGLIKDFMLGGKPWGDLPVIVCDCEIGYPNQIIYGTDVLLMKCRKFSVNEESVIIETC